jgi:hypothetical protein
VDKTGQHLLHYPVLDRGCPVGGPLRAVAKCGQGTAAWHSFQTSDVLRSDLLNDRSVCLFSSIGPHWCSLF